MSGVGASLEEENRMSNDGLSDLEEELNEILARTQIHLSDLSSDESTEEDSELEACTDNNPSSRRSLRNDNIRKLYERQWSPSTDREGEVKEQGEEGEEKKDTTTSSETGEEICNICLEVLFRPTTLTCGHNFCRHCILRLPLHHHRGTRSIRRGGYHDHHPSQGMCISCPLCRKEQPIKQMLQSHVNQQLSNLILRLHPSMQQKLQNREREFARYQSMMDDLLAEFLDRGQILSLTAFMNLINDYMLGLSEPSSSSSAPSSSSSSSSQRQPERFFSSRARSRERTPVNSRRRVSRSPLARPERMSSLHYIDLDRERPRERRDSRPPSDPQNTVWIKVHFRHLDIPSPVQVTPDEENSNHQGTEEKEERETATSSTSTTPRKWGWQELPSEDRDIFLTYGVADWMREELRLFLIDDWLQQRRHSPSFLAQYGVLKNMRSSMDNQNFGYCGGSGEVKFTPDHQIYRTPQNWKDVCNLMMAWDRQKTQGGNSSFQQQTFLEHTLRWVGSLSPEFVGVWRLLCASNHSITLSNISSIMKGLPSVTPPVPLPHASSSSENRPRHRRRGSVPREITPPLQRNESFPPGSPRWTSGPSQHSYHFGSFYF